MNPRTARYSIIQQPNHRHVAASGVGFGVADEQGVAVGLDCHAERAVAPAEVDQAHVVGIQAAVQSPAGGDSAGAEIDSQFATVLRRGVTRVGALILC